MPSLKCEYDGNLTYEVVDSSDGFYAGKATSNHNEGQKSILVLHALAVCFFHLLDQTIAQFDCIPKRLHQKGTLFQTRSS
jgi:hypothetical protein